MIKGLDPLTKILKKLILNSDLIHQVVVRVVKYIFKNKVTKYD